MNALREIIGEANLDVELARRLVQQYCHNPPPPSSSASSHQKNKQKISGVHQQQQIVDVIDVDCEIVDEANLGRLLNAYFDATAARNKTPHLQWKLLYNFV
ncbi:hypothetical protein Pelo_19549 [Pelomyxa schiedti]|nr:hypothetical protein Pelo_19549 [Pelomyxa schiedti]